MIEKWLLGLSVTASASASGAGESRSSAIAVAAIRIAFTPLTLLMLFQSLAPLALQAEPDVLEGLTCKAQGDGERDGAKKATKEEAE